MIRMVKNVTHYYTDPISGEKKSVYIGDGTFEEVQKKIEDYMRVLHDSANTQTQSNPE